MAIAFDAVGGGGADTSDPLSISWSHSAAGGSDCVVLIGFAATPGLGNSTTNRNGLTPTVTYGGQAAMLVGYCNVGSNDNLGTVYFYAYWNPPTGSQTVQVDLAGGTPAVLHGNSVSYTGVVGIRNTFQNASNASTDQSITVPTTSGRYYVHIGSGTTGSLSSYTQTARYTDTTTHAIAIGDAAGTGSNITMGYTGGSTSNGHCVLELIAPTESAVRLRSIGTGGRTEGSSSTLSTSGTHRLDTTGPGTVAMVCVVTSASSDVSTATISCTYGGNSMTQEGMVQYGGFGVRTNIGIYSLRNPPTGNSTINVNTGGGGTKTSVMYGSAVYTNVDTIGSVVQDESLGVTVTTDSNARAIAVTLLGGPIDADGVSHNEIYRNGDSVSGAGDYMCMQDNVGSTTFSNTGSGSSSNYSLGIALTALAVATGTEAATLRNLLFAGSGTHTAPATSGTVDADLRAPLFAGAGTPSQTGSVSATLRALNASVAALNHPIGTVSAGTRAPTFSGSGFPTQSGSVAAALRTPTASLAGVMQPSGTASTTLQPLTTSLNGTSYAPGAIVLDAVGGGNVDTSSTGGWTLSWTHSAAGGEDNCVLITAAATPSLTSSGFYRENFSNVVCTYGGVNAMLLAAVDMGVNDNLGTMFTWIIWDPPTGSQTINISLTPPANPGVFHGNSVSYTGVRCVNQVWGDGSGATSSPSTTVPTVGGRLYYHAFTTSSASLTSYSAAERWREETNDVILVGDAVGTGSDVSFDLSTGSTSNCHQVIELVPSIDESAVAALRSIGEGGVAGGTSDSLSDTFVHELDQTDEDYVAIVGVIIGVSTSSVDTTCTVTWGVQAMTQQTFVTTIGTDTNRAAIGFYTLRNPAAGNITVTVQTGGTSQKSHIAAGSIVCHNVEAIGTTVEAADTSITVPSTVNGRAIAVTTNGNEMLNPSHAEVWRLVNVVGGVADAISMQHGVGSPSVAFTNDTTNSSPFSLGLFLSGREPPSGTVAAALQRMTASFSGNQPYTAAIAGTLQPVTLSGSGTHRQTGTASATMRAPLSTLAGALVPQGTVAGTLQNLAAAAAGTHRQSGAISADLQEVTATLSGVMVPSGAISASLQRALASASGSHGQSGTIAGALENLLAALSGAQGQQGSVSAELVEPAFAGAASQGQQGAISAAAQSALMSGSGAQTLSGTAAAALQRIITSLSGVMQPRGSVTASLNDPTFSASGAHGDEGSVGATLQRVVTALTGVMVPSGTVTAALQRATLGGSGAQTQSGAIGSALENLTAALAGSHGQAGTLAAASRMAFFAGAGSAGQSAAMTASLEALTTALTGAQTQTGSVAVALQVLSAALSGVMQPAGALGAELEALTAGASGGHGQSGVVVATIPALTSSISGVMLPQGAIAADVQAVTFDAAAIAIGAGEMIAALPEPLLTAAGWAEAVGDMSAALAVPEATASGGQAYLTTLSAAIRPLVGVLSGVMQPSGSVAGALQGPLMSASGSPVQAGGVAAALGLVTFAGSATMQPSGALTGALGDLSFTGLAGNQTDGALAGSLEYVLAALEGNQGQSSSIASSLRPVAASASGAQVYAGALAASLDTLVAGLAGAQAHSGVVVAALTPATLSMAGIHAQSGAISAVVPGVVIIASGTSIGAPLRSTMQPAEAAFAGGQLMFGSLSVDLLPMTSVLVGQQVIQGPMAVTLGALIFDSDGFIAIAVPTAPVRILDSAPGSGILVPGGKQNIRIVTPAYTQERVVKPAIRKT